MGLETANFIPELVQSNPIGASDPVSEGDNHLRMLKIVLQNQFPAFVSTTGSPDPVTLTESQINVLIDAAIKNIVQTISGLWTFTGDNIHQGLETFENFVAFEDNAGNVTLETVTAALGSLLIADQADANVMKAGFRNPVEITVAGGGVLTQAMEGQVGRYAGVAGLVNVPVLEAQTNIGLIHSGSGDITLTESGVTLNWLDGLGAANTGPRTIAPNSIIHMRWSTASLVDVWGNGIT